MRDCLLMVFANKQDLPGGEFDSGNPSAPTLRGGHGNIDRSGEMETVNSMVSREGLFSGER